MNKKHLTLAIFIMLFLSLKSLAFYADQIPPKVETLIEEAFSHSSLLPEEIRGQWRIDNNASKKLLEQLITKPTKQETMLLELLMSNDAIIYQFLEDSLIAKHHSDEITFDATFVAKRDNLYQVELNHDNNSSTLWLSLTDEKKLNMKGRHFLAHEFLLWVRIAS
ncbi:hypothetical protein [Thalassotalea ganghwensis]